MLDECLVCFDQFTGTCNVTTLKKLPFTEESNHASQDEIVRFLLEEDQEDDSNPLTVFTAGSQEEEGGGAGGR